MSKTNNELPNVMDDHSSVEEITGIFTNKYNILYNTVNYNTNDMKRLSDDIDHRIENGCPNISDSSNHTHIITVQEVKDDICQLKQDKKEENGLYSNHFKKWNTKIIYNNNITIQLYIDTWNSTC